MKRFIKKHICVLALLAVLVFSPLAIHASSLTVELDSTEIPFAGQGPVIVDSRTFVPVRGVFEAMGFDVDWIGATSTAVLTRGNDIIEISIGETTFTVNGVSLPLDAPARLIGGSTMLPLRAVLESVGYELDFDGATQTVLITSAAVIPYDIYIDGTGFFLTFVAETYIHWADEPHYMYWYRVEDAFEYFSDMRPAGQQWPADEWHFPGEIERGQIFLRRLSIDDSELLFRYIGTVNEYGNTVLEQITMPGITYTDIDDEMIAEIRDILGIDFTLPHAETYWVDDAGVMRATRFLNLEQPVDTRGIIRNSTDNFNTQPGDAYVVFRIEGDDTRVTLAIDIGDAVAPWGPARAIHMIPLGEHRPQTHMDLDEETLTDIREVIGVDFTVSRFENSFVFPDTHQFAGNRSVSRLLILDEPLNLEGLEMDGTGNSTVQTGDVVIFTRDGGETFWIQVDLGEFEDEVWGIMRAMHTIQQGN